MWSVTFTPTHIFKCTSNNAQVTHSYTSYTQTYILNLLTHTYAQAFIHSSTLIYPYSFICIHLHIHIKTFTHDIFVYTDSDTFNPLIHLYIHSNIHTHLTHTFMLTTHTFTCIHTPTLFLWKNIQTYRKFTSLLEFT